MFLSYCFVFESWNVRSIVDSANGDFLFNLRGVAMFVKGKLVIIAIRLILYQYESNKNLNNTINYSDLIANTSLLTHSQSVQVK
jgi:hypothetical protein